MENARIAYDYKDLKKSLRYVIQKLMKLDDGDYVELDFLATEDIGRFCRMVGFKRNWAGRTIDEICGKPKPDFGPKVVQADDARIVLNILKSLIKSDVFSSHDGSPFDKTLLNDFFDKGGRFAGKPTLGHFWEFQYALQVELEHGRTRGTNVTNNHPLLTAFVVMAHLAEDTLYYARLWCMETEGELTNAVLAGKKKDEIADIAEELVRAKAYLGKRLVEKADANDMEIPV